MLLSARLLNGVADVNHFEVVSVLEDVAGGQQDVYFQVIDASTEKFSNPPGRRYVPATGATLQVTFQSLNSDQTVSAYCDQPFSGDLSVWRFRWPAPPFADASFDPAKTVGTFAMKMVLSEPGTTMPAAWSAVTTYALGNLASYGGAAWKSLNSGNLNNVPADGSIWWARMNMVQPRTLTGFVSQALSIALAAPEF